MGRKVRVYHGISIWHAWTGENGVRVAIDEIDEDAW